MTQQFTASEVRDYADACRLLHKGPVIADMLRAFADLLEAGEKAVPVAEVCHGANVITPFGKDGVRIEVRWLKGANPKVGEKLYTRPQPAQDALGAVLEVALSIMDANDPLNAARLRKMRDAAMAKESGR